MRDHAVIEWRRTHPKLPYLEEIKVFRRLKFHICFAYFYSIYRTRYVAMESYFAPDRVCFGDCVNPMH